ncbi:MAG: hypothetical protein ISR65_03195 [Bacteriovoracaceae bacterium]|nr:hypothetical protein [Bacteriovoracaceae bacterium]
MLKILGGTLVVAGAVYLVYKYTTEGNVGEVNHTVKNFSNRVKHSFHEGYASVAAS